MDITVLTSSEEHPVYAYLQKWIQSNAAQHNIELCLKVDEVNQGDFLFLISCGEVVPAAVREKYKYCLVVHASDLPKGRGWSPHIWQILEGKDEIVVSLLEVEDKVDTGAIWKKEIMKLEGHELYDEINTKLFQITLNLMDYAIKNCDDSAPQKQSESEASYYSKRTPDDSRIDISLPLQEQFDLLRVADTQRFPAFFEHRGHRYTIKIEKDD